MAMKDKQLTILNQKYTPVTVSTDGAGGPYIMIGHDQLDEVIDLLRKNGIGFQEDKDAATGIAAINLGAGADADAIQNILDSAKEKEVFSYEVTGAFEGYTITKHPHDKGDFKKFEDAVRDVITKLSADIASYGKGVQVQDTRKDRMMKLHKDLRDCTEENCPIFSDATRLRGAGRFPAPETQ
jgi:hypothetical protein